MSAMLRVCKFKGAVRVESRNPEELWIGDENFITKIEEMNFKKPVTVAVVIGVFTGDLEADPGGTGYSEWTPGWPAKLKVGGHDLLEELQRHRGSPVTVIVSDGPVNLLEVLGATEETDD